jgi:methyl-accepting chemotaxis protein
MTADEAINAHRQWKSRFRVALTQRQALDVATIASDCHCEFGIWLHGDALANFGQHARYATCVAHHAAFHLEAGKIAEKVNQREFLAVEGMMSRHSPYSQASEALIESVVALFLGQGES